MASKQATRLPKATQRTDEQIDERLADLLGGTSDLVTDLVAICPVCGKALDSDGATNRGLGALCAERVRLVAGWTKEQMSEVSPAQLRNAVAETQRIGWLAHKQYEKLPSEGSWVKVSDVHKAVDAAGKTVSSFVRAFGGDRGMFVPKAAYWRPIYVGSIRYLPSECLEHLNELTDKRIAR